MATAAKKKAPAKAASGGGMAARLAALKASKPTSKKKSGKPDVKLTCETECKEYAEQLRIKKDAEAKLGDLGQIINEEAEEQLVSLSRKTGAVQTSLRLNNLLTFVSGASRYCQIPALGEDGEPSEQAQGLKRIFGDKYDEYFLEGNELTVKMDLTDDLLEALVEACDKLGVEFGDVFASKSLVKPTEKFTSDRIMDAGVQAKFEEARDAGLVKPYKSTLKE